MFRGGGSGRVVGLGLGREARVTVVSVAARRKLDPGSPLTRRESVEWETPSKAPICRNDRPAPRSATIRSAAPQARIAAAEKGASGA
jgi:hypothetical protein